jgi:hypothetical protein
MLNNDIQKLVNIFREESQYFDSNFLFERKLRPIQDMFSRYEFLQWFSQSIDALKEQNDCDILLKLPLLIRGIVDFSIDVTEDHEGIYNYKQQIIQVNYLAFNGQTQNALELLASTETPEGIKEKIIIDKTDRASWSSTNPIFLDCLYKKMVKQGYSPNHIVLGGHGAYRAGLMFATMLGINNIHTIRCSLHKMDDKGPILPEYEKKSLGDKLRGSTVLIYEEDVECGRSIESLKKLVMEFEPKEIKTATSQTKAPRKTDFYGFHCGSFF